MTDCPTIRTQADLEHTWRHLMEPLGFDGHCLWFMLIDADDHPLPGLTRIEDLEEVPEPDELEALGEMLASLREAVVPDGRVAFLLTRPGREGATARDREWAGALYAAIPAAGVPTDVVHLATDVTLRPVPIDDTPVHAPA
ncbi:MAG: hypothetical protein M3237_07850 [Actinomycetota bacterium]|nr:hypothetical protein [Actinomycetota bacterium]